MIHTSVSVTYNSVDYKPRTPVLLLLLFGSKGDNPDDLPHREETLHDMTKLVPDFLVEVKAAFDQNNIMYGF